MVGSSVRCPPLGAGQGRNLASRIGLVIGLAALGCRPPHDVADPDTVHLDQHLEGLDQALDDILSAPGDRPFSGVLLVARGQDVVFERAVGLADRHAGSPISVESAFVIASLSKQFTATLVLRAVDREELDLDAAVSEYLPDLDDPWADRATVRQLLNHTSGLPDPQGDVASEPGANFRYSNRGYALLGEIVSRVAGRSFEDQLDELASSCDMQSSLAGEPAALVRGYEEVERGDLRLASGRDEGETVPLPAGGMVSTARELHRWNRCLHGGRALSRASYADMIEPTTTRSHRYGTVGYGFGVQRLDDAGIVELSHNGYLPGTMSTMLYYPETQTSVIVLENVSWETDDMARAFSVHDAVRDAVRRSSLSHG